MLRILSGCLSFILGRKEGGGECRFAWNGLSFGLESVGSHVQLHLLHCGWTLRHVTLHYVYSFIWMILCPKNRACTADDSTWFQFFLWQFVLSFWYLWMAHFTHKSKINWNQETYWQQCISCRVGLGLGCVTWINNCFCHLQTVFANSKRKWYFMISNCLKQINY